MTTDDTASSATAASYDGTFSVSASKSVPLDQLAALDLAIHTLIPWAGSAPRTVSRDGKYPNARWNMDVGTLLVSADRLGSGGTSLTLTRQRLPDSKAADAEKLQLTAQAEAIVASLASA